jgi:hypothetical protein
MPEAKTTAAPQVVALAMMVSAIVLGVVAFLIFSGFLPLGRIAALVVGAAAFADLLIGIVFFRKGQSS